MPVCITITLRGLMVAVLWIAGAAVAAIDVVHPGTLAGLSIGFMLGGATLSVLARIDRYAANWETAYDVGREVSKVRQMR